MKQAGTPLPISVLIVFSFLLMAIVSIVKYSIDFAYPDSVGLGMFGFMAIGLLFRLGIPTVVLIVGTILFVSASKQKGKWLRRAGSALVIIASVVLLLMALIAARSRKQSEIREDYPNRSVEELLLLAHDDEESMWATPALREKNDPAAVPGLCEILLDETEMLHLRWRAADALGGIGGKQAREALEKVRASNPPEDLLNAVKDALEEIMGLPKEPENSKVDEPRTEPAVTTQTKESTLTNKMPDNEKRTIFGATVVDDGQFIVVTRELEEKGDEENYVIRFLKCGPTGEIQHMSVSSEDTLAHISHDLPTSGKGQEIALLYATLDSRVAVLELEEGEVRKHSMGLQPDDGPAVECWAARVGGKKKLFVQKYVPLSRQIPHLEYAWIYCYSFDNKHPILEAKVPIESGTMSASRVKCAPAGDDVLIWQTFSTGNSDTETLRVAKWNKSGKLAWNNLYTGDIFGFTIDPNNGSKATLWEGKETEDGRLRYVQYAVGPGIAKPIPVDTSRSGVILRLLRVPAKRTWVGATSNRYSVRITIFDDDFAEQTVKTYFTNKAEDIALAEKYVKFYLIVLRINDLVIKDIDTLPKLKPE